MCRKAVRIETFHSLVVSSSPQSHSSSTYPVSIFDVLAAIYLSPEKHTWTRPASPQPWGLAPLWPMELLLLRLDCSGCGHAVERSRAEQERASTACSRWVHGPSPVTEGWGKTGKHGCKKAVITTAHLRQEVQYRGLYRDNIWRSNTNGENSKRVDKGREHRKKVRRKEGDPENPVDMRDFRRQRDETCLKKKKHRTSKQLDATKKKKRKKKRGIDLHHLPLNRRI